MLYILTMFSHSDTINSSFKNTKKQIKIYINKKSITYKFDRKSVTTLRFFDL